MPIIFFLFVAVPIIEIWVLIEIGSQIGVFNTILMVILTAIVGTAMLRIQGLSIVARVRSQVAANQLPTAEILEGLFLLVGGALLLTPGFVTDAIGFMCLLPLTRNMMSRGLTARFIRRGHTARQQPGDNNVPKRPAGSRETHTLEGEYQRED